MAVRTFDSLPSSRAISRSMARLTSLLVATQLSSSPTHVPPTAGARYDARCDRCSTLSKACGGGEVANAREQYLQALSSLTETTKSRAERLAGLLAKQGELQSGQVGRFAEDLVRRTRRNRETVGRRRRGPPRAAARRRGLGAGPPRGARAPAAPRPRPAGPPPAGPPPAAAAVPPPARAAPPAAPRPRAPRPVRPARPSPVPPEPSRTPARASRLDPARPVATSDDLPDAPVLARDTAAPATTWCQTGCLARRRG